MKSILALLMVILPGIWCCAPDPSSPRFSNYARKVHQRLLTIDTHCDTPLDLIRGRIDLGIRQDPRATDSKVDLIRMAEGGLDVSFFAVFIAQRSLNPEGFAAAYQRAARMLDVIDRALADYPQLASLATSADELMRVARSGRRAILIGLENGYPIDYDLNRLDEFYRRGVRYVTLCHTRNNHICDSSNDTTLHGGLSTFGCEVVRKMNRLGMIIDVSHISDQSFDDVLQLSQAPVMASHSCVRALCDNPRNLSDDMLLRLAKQGGVTQLCLFSEYITAIPANAARDSAQAALKTQFPSYDDLTESQRELYHAISREIDQRYPPHLASVADICDHIDYVVRLVGIDHVGIGTDFDGGGELADCYDVSELANITAELLRRGYRRTDLQKIWGANFLRVFRQVEETARCLSANG